MHFSLFFFTFFAHCIKLFGFQTARMSINICIYPYLYVHVYISEATANGRINIYLRRGSYVVVVVCLFVCLFGLLATLRENFRTKLHEVSKEGRQWATEPLVKFR